MNWFATVIFAILEVALRSLANAYKFVGNSRQIGSKLADLGEMKTSKARPCLAVALSIVLIVCLTSLVTTVSAAPADPGHPASSVSAGTFEAGNFTFPDNLTITDYLIVDTDTLYVDALNNRVGVGTSSPATNLNVKGTLNTALTGTFNTSDFSDVANTSDDLTSEISVGDAIKIVNASDSSDYEIFTVNAVTSANLTLDSTPSDNWTEALGYKDSDLFRIDDGDGTGKLIVDKTGNVGIGTTGPANLLEILQTGGTASVGDQLILDHTGSGGQATSILFESNGADTGRIGWQTTGKFAITALNSNDDITLTPSGTGDVLVTTGNVGIGTTGPSYLLEVADGTEDAVNLSGVLYVNDTSNNVGIGLTNPGEKLEVSGNINVTGGNDICIGGGGKCLSTTGTGDGDLTDVLAGYGIAVDNSGGPSPRVNLSNSSAGAGLNYTAGVLAVGDGEGVTVAADSVGFDCSEVTDSASDGMRCSSEDIVAGAGDGLTANNTDLEINQGEGVGILADILHFDCSEVTDTANDAVTCSTEDLVIGAGNGLTANATGLEIDLYTGSGLLVDATGLSMNRSCSNGEILKWVTSGSFWNCTEDAGLGSESDTLDSVADRGATTDQNVTIDSDSDGLTNIANTLYVNGTIDGVGIGTTNPGAKLDVEDTSAGINELIRLSHQNAYDAGAKISWWADDAGEMNRIENNLTTDETTSGNLGFYTYTSAGGLTEKMRIMGSGNVGIGTVSPGSHLQINETPGDHSANPTLSFGDGDTGLYESSDDDLVIGRAGVYHFGITSSGIISGTGTGPLVAQTGASATVPTLVPNREDTNTGIGGTGDDNLSIITGGTEAIRIDSSQNVGINTTDPNYPLVVQGVIGGKDSNGVDRFYMNPETNGVDMWLGNIRFDSRTNADSYFNSGGDVGIGVTTPEARLEALASSGPQLMLTHTEATDYANFTVDSDGNLTILSSSGNVFIQLG